MNQPTPPSEPRPDEWASGLAALERERLLSYVEWGEVARSGVSTPRFRAMPGRLRRTFRPIVVVGVAALVAVAGGLLIAREPPLLLMGLVIGTCLAVAGWVHTTWYRSEARRLAREHGLRG